MKAPLLTLVITCLLTAAPFAQAGSKGGTSLTGAWAGYNAPRGPGSTGGNLFLDFDPGVKTDAKAAVPRNPISGFIQVPALGEGTISLKPITGTISARGVIRGKFQGGSLRGRLNRGGHDARGSVYLNTGLYWALGFWFADEGSAPTTN